MGTLDGSNIVTPTGTPSGTEAPRRASKVPAAKTRHPQRSRDGIMVEGAQAEAIARPASTPLTRSPGSVARTQPATQAQPSESDLLQLVELSGGGLWTCDGALRLTYVSPQTAGLLTDLGGGGTGTQLTEVVHLIASPLLGDLATVLGNAIAGQRYDPLIVSGLSASGQRLFLEMPICATQPGVGSAVRLHGLLRPFELPGERDALVARLMTAVDSFETAVALTRGDGRIVYANVRLLALVGFAVQDVIDHPLEDIVEMVDRARAAEDVPGSAPCRMLGSDGESTACMMATAALPDACEEPTARLHAFMPMETAATRDQSFGEARRAAAQVAESLGIISALMRWCGEPALPGSLRSVLSRTATDCLPDVLTARQRQIAAEILAGRSTRETAVTLGLSIETVRTHQKDLYRRLGVRGRSDLLLQFAGAAECS